MSSVYCRNLGIRAWFCMESTQNSRLCHLPGLWMCTRELVDDVIWYWSLKTHYFGTHRIELSSHFSVFCLFPLLLLSHSSTSREIMSGCSVFTMMMMMMVIVLTFAIRSKVISPMFRIGKMLVGKLPFCFDIIILLASIPFAYFYYFSLAFFSICCFVLQ